MSLDGAVKARGLIALAAVAAVCAGLALGDSGAASAARPQVKGPPPAFAWLMSRVVSARVHHTRIAVVQNTNARRIGRSLASLRPTWVTGTLRYARNQYPTHAEVRAWHQIRRVVHQSNPYAQFDIVLNANQYRTPAAIRMTMNRLRAKLHNEGWFFDFMSTSFAKHPRVIKTAVKVAHRHGEWIGGNVFGIAARQRLPRRADFWSVQDSVFHLRLHAVRRLVRHKPILYHLQNNPAHRRSGGCRFIKDLSSVRRRALIRRRSAQSARIGFRVAYPVLFPECIGHRPKSGRPVLYSYNAFRDPLMIREIHRQLDRHQLAG